MVTFPSKSKYYGYRVQFKKPQTYEEQYAQNEGDQQVRDENRELASVEDDQGYYNDQEVQDDAPSYDEESVNAGGFEF